MRVTVTPRTEALIQARLETGRYSSADEVVQSAIILLEARERLRSLRALLIDAEAEVREGKVVESIPELRQQLREATAEMVRLGLLPNPDVGSP